MDVAEGGRSAVALRRRGLTLLVRPVRTTRAPGQSGRRAIGAGPAAQAAPMSIREGTRRSRARPGGARRSQEGDRGRRESRDALGGPARRTFGAGSTKPTTLAPYSGCLTSLRQISWPMSPAPTITVFCSYAPARLQARRATVRARGTRHRARVENTRTPATPGPAKPIRREATSTSHEAIVTTWSTPTMSSVVQ